MIANAAGADDLQRVDTGCDVAVQNPNRYGDVKVARERQWLARLVAELAPAATSCAVRFVGDRAIRQMNRRYRGSDNATDVLTFPGERSPEGEHLGDIAISVPAARRQATGAGHTVDREIKILLLHGVLHCLGYDHETDDGEMEAIERRLQRRWIEADVRE